MLTWIKPGPDGFFIEPAGAWLDPKKPCAKAVISHAHGDHYTPHQQEVFATPETIALGKARLGKRAGRIHHEIKYHEPFTIGDCTFTFFSAGHVLGSAQILVTFKGETLLYSGDMEMRRQLTCPPVEFPESRPDLLICESTFGEKEAHEDPEAAIKKIHAASGLKPLLIGVYPVGKAQEITKLLQLHFPETRIFLQGEILKYHRIYESAGADLGEYSPYQRKNARRSAQKFALLVPARMMSGYSRDQEFYKVLASGFNQKIRIPHLDGHLEISGHASRNDLQDYISRVNPAKILFWHGYPRGLVPFCQERNIPAFQLNLQQIRPLW